MREPAQVRFLVLPGQARRPEADLPTRSLLSFPSGPGGGAQISHAHGGSSDELKQQTTWTEVCYLDLYAAEGEFLAPGLGDFLLLATRLTGPRLFRAERSTLKYTKEVVTKDGVSRSPPYIRAPSVQD